MISGWLPAEDEAGASRIGSAVEHTVVRPDDRRSRRVAPIAGDGHAMAESIQSIGGGLGNPAFEVQLAWHEFVIAEGTAEMLGLEARRFDGFLRAHAEVEDVQDDLQEGLVLIVAAWRGENHLQLTGLGDQGGAEGDARALAGLQLVGMPGGHHEALQAAGERDSRIAGDY